VLVDQRSFECSQSWLVPFVLIRYKRRNGVNLLVERFRDIYLSVRMQTTITNATIVINISCNVGNSKWRRNEVLAMNWVIYVISMCYTIFINAETGR
jgi:hypothetical protein